MRPLDAVAAGYDEITHINFMMMQAMPEEVVDKANTAAAVRGAGQVSPRTSTCSRPAMRAFIAELKQRGTIVDPTLVIFEQTLTLGRRHAVAGLCALYGDHLAGARPQLQVGRLSAGRGLHARRLSQELSPRWSGWCGALHKAGVPIVAGTDGCGIELVRELELYQQAGFTPAEALQSATIVPARVVGADKRTGSIAVGKEADWCWSTATCRRTRRAAAGGDGGQRRLR